MPLPRSPVWVRTASWIFRLCARLAPRSFRDRFGSESEETFQHLLEHTRHDKGAGAAMTTAAAACGDIAKTGIAERASTWRRAAANGVGGDLGQSLRIYTREPLLAGSLVILLALVAGPALAVFSALYGIVLAPLPYPNADRLVTISRDGPNAHVAYLRAAAVADYRPLDAFESIGGIFPIGFTVAQDGPPERVSGFRATGGLLTALEVPFVAGRDLARGDADVVVVTRAFAVARFGSEAAAIDRSLSVTNRPMRIIGVLAYRPTLPGGMMGGELFVPHVVADAAAPSRRMSQAIVIARLKPGVSHGTAEQQIRVTDARIQKEFGETVELSHIVPLSIATSGPLRVPLLLLSAVIVVVFLIGVAGLASLVLSRAASRAGDVAVRTALGASRARLIRAWLVEGATVAIPGAALGMWLGMLVLDYAHAAYPGQLIVLPETRALGPALLSGLAAAAVATLMFGLAPLGGGLLRVSALTFVRQAADGAGLRRVRLQSLLIAGQVAVSLVLVVGALLLSMGLWRALTKPVGFDTANLTAISLRTAQPPARQLEVAREVVAALEAADSTPGASVAASSLPLPGVNGGAFAVRRIRADWPAFADHEMPVVSPASVSTNYFQVVGIPVIEGRVFRADDEAGPNRVIVLGRSFATRWFPDGALGKFVSFQGTDRREVIGIVEDVHAGRLGGESRPQCYMPLSELSLGGPSNFVVRGSLPIAAVRGTVSSVLKTTDPRAQVLVMSATEAMALSLLVQTTIGKLIMALAVVALLLAVVNVYALSAFAVAQRRREIGIRLALGASGREAIRLVMRRALAWSGAGLVAGTAVALAVVAPLLQQQIVEARSADRWLVGLALVVVSCIAAVASWLPARRAASIDPAITLRAE